MSTDNLDLLTLEQRNIIIGQLVMEDLPRMRLMGLLDEELIELAESYGYTITTEAVAEHEVA
jgi:hypothetical protein